jgi:hypothetical protein
VVIPGRVTETADIVSVLQPIMEQHELLAPTMASLPTTSALGSCRCSGRAPVQIDDLVRWGVTDRLSASDHDIVL